MDMIAMLAGLGQQMTPEESAELHRQRAIQEEVIAFAQKDTWAAQKTFLIMLSGFFAGWFLRGVAERGVER